jgi:small subunit ribosomal protein S2
MRTLGRLRGRLSATRTCSTTYGAPSPSSGTTDADTDTAAFSPPTRPPLPPPAVSGRVPPIRAATDPLPQKILNLAPADPYELQHLNSFLGFSSKRTHPSAFNYLLGAAGGQAIIDPEETLTAMRRTMQLIKSVSFRGGRTLFVSTQPTLARLCRVVGEQSGQFYLAKRWVPGLLTNWRKSREHIHAKLRPDPLMEAAGKLKYSDLQKANFFRGVEHMTRPPDLIFRFDSTPLYGEPARLNVPLLSVVDSDTVSADVDYPIPANTKSLRFYHTLSHMLVRAVNEGRSLRAELEHYGVKDVEEDAGGRGKQQQRGGGGNSGGGNRRGYGRGSGGGGAGDRFRAPDKFGNVRGQPRT